MHLKARTPKLKKKKNGKPILIGMQMSPKGFKIPK